MNATAEQIAPTPALDIQIVADKAARGRKAIMVDGTRWGTIHMHSAGANGAYYWFEQIGDHGGICRQGPRHWKGSNRTTSHPVKVWGNKTAMRQAGVWRNAIGEAAKAERDAFPSVEARLMTETQKLIAEGLLRDPAVVEDEQRRASEAHRKREARRDAEELAEFEVRAAQCLAPIADHIGENMRAAMLADIVAAMRWAQTK